MTDGAGSAHISGQSATPNAAVQPSEPTRPVLVPGSPEDKLNRNLRDAILSLSIYFRTETTINGIDATDLFALNSSLGGTIENQVVETLNAIRKVWDPKDEWVQYRFERRSQSFPDVRLTSRMGGKVNTAVGIELKGWYLLSKEGVPSFRYRVTPSACAPNDLLVIVPWRLKNVLSGQPVVHAPYIESARYAAEFRNYWWQYRRDAKGNPGINVASSNPYPQERTGTNDNAVFDNGGNFGRVARLGLPELEAYIEETLAEPVSGIAARDWIQFFKVFTDAGDPQRTWGRIQGLINEYMRAREADAERATSMLREIVALLNGI